MAVESIISKLSSEALTKAVANSDALIPSTKDGSSFKEILTNVDSGFEFADQLGMTNELITPNGDPNSVAGNGVDFKAGEEAFGIGKPDTTQKIVDLLGEVNKGQLQMDSLVNTVLYGDKKLSNQELLCVQAHIFHFAQITELTVKVAEQSVSSVKTVLNTQVQ